MSCAGSSPSSKAMPEGTLIFKTFRGEVFEVEKALVKEWEALSPLIEHDFPDLPIPLLNLNSHTLSLVIEFSRKHAEFTTSSVGAHDKANEDLKKWDDYFDFDAPMIFDIILAADYLCFQKLLEIACEKVAEMIEGKTPEQVRETFRFADADALKEVKEVQKYRWTF